MKGINIKVIAVLTVIALLVLSVVGMYNGLVNSQEEALMAWSQVENVYQRRHDLIPNYVKTVEAYANHEKDVFKAVSDARAEIGRTKISMKDLNDTEKFKAYQAAQDNLQSSIGRLLMVVENYPQLKSDQNFMKLQDVLEGSENRIAVERMRYNERATDFNKKIRRVPYNLIKGFGNFDRIELFKMKQGADTPPEVNFSR